jgi:hypothetical protein
LPQLIASCKLQILIENNKKLQDNKARGVTIRYVTTEADTCRKYVLPKLYEAGRNDDQISEQRTFTDGRIMVTATRSGGNLRNGLTIFFATAPI